MNLEYADDEKMEYFKKNTEKEKDIMFSRTIRAGKRIYYIDVKKNKKGDLYLSITESKRILSEESENPSVNFEKHKIFLYQEDLEHFTSGLDEAIQYMRGNPNEEYRPEENHKSGEIDININF